MRWLPLLITLLFFMPTLSNDVRETPSLKDGNLVNEPSSEITSETSEDTGGTEYWALLVAVGVYANAPAMDRPSMLVEVENFYNALLVSDMWDESHIKKITAENATVINIFKGFKWLAENADENDICLIYITTHGFPIMFDLPPFDEADGMDEALAAYRGFLPFQSPWSWEQLANPFGIITDDEINFMLNRINAKGICFIVDSCHSGGFNDNWSYSIEESFAKELIKDLKGRNRIVMASVPEDKVSYGSFFSHYIIEGMEGYADENNDSICTAEEIFRYAEPIIRKETGMEPQMFDDYPGEMPLREVELPPSITSVEGNEIGKTNLSMTYNITAVDPEGNRIRYHINWGDGSEEDTGYYDSGATVSISHVWSREGTYEMSIVARDERGAEGDAYYTTVTMAGEHDVVDQRQVEQEYAYLINNTRWLAQSFVPSVDTITKIELGIIAWNSGYDVEVSIRDALDGSILGKASKVIEPTNDWETQWVMFNLGNVKVTPGQQYYIVCRSSKPDWGVAWVVGNNVYSGGTFYQSRNTGHEWRSVEDVDACFVTYGR